MFYKDFKTVHDEYTGGTLFTKVDGHCQMEYVPFWPVNSYKDRWWAFLPEMIGTHANI